MPHGSLQALDRSDFIGASVIRERIGSPSLTPASQQTTLVPLVRSFLARLPGRLMNALGRRSRGLRSVPDVGDS